MSPVRTARADELDALALVLAHAYEAAPLLRWILPYDAQRERAAPVLFRIALRRSFEDGLVFTTDGREGVALAAPPGGLRMHLLRDLLLALEAAWVLRSGLWKTWIASCATRERSRLPPHWSLEALGVTPERQGRGIGSLLVTALLARCDAEGTPASLEATTPRNVRLYEGLGFRVTGQTALPRGPRVWAMWREPR